MEAAFDRIADLKSSRPDTKEELSVLFEKYYVGKKAIGASYLSQESINETKRHASMQFKVFS